MKVQGHYATYIGENYPPLLRGEEGIVWKHPIQGYYFAPGLDFNDIEGRSVNVDQSEFIFTPIH